MKYGKGADECKKNNVYISEDYLQLFKWCTADSSEVGWLAIN